MRIGVERRADNKRVEWSTDVREGTTSTTSTSIDLYTDVRRTRSKETLVSDLGDALVDRVTL